MLSILGIQMHEAGRALWIQYGRPYVYKYIFVNNLKYTQFWKTSVYFCHCILSNTQISMICGIWGILGPL